MHLEEWMSLLASGFIPSSWEIPEGSVEEFLLFTNGTVIGSSAGFRLLVQSIYEAV